MSDELLPYYNRELSFFRRMADGFARENPKIASRLRLGSDTTDDPHVERLIEAFALLNARTRHKLEDDFPEVSDALLNILYPHYLAPIPSMAIVQFTLDESQAGLASGYRIPAGTGVETGAVEGEPCRFQTRYPVHLWPLVLESAQLAGRPISAPATPRSSEAAAVLRLSLRTFGREASFADLTFDRLRFFLKGVPQYVNQVYELLFHRTLQVALARSPQDPDPIVLDADVLRPVGFGRDEGMLPYPSRSPLGYRLLSEYFNFPQKFMFFELSGLEASVRERFEAELDVYLYLEASTVDLEQNVSGDTFRLGCTPVVNLYRQRAEPIQMTGTETEYRVVPDARRLLANEVYSIDNVVATTADGDEEAYKPFYSLDHGSTSGHLRYWHASRRPGEADAEKADEGTEVYLTFVNTAFDPAVEEDVYVDIETTCLNRDLPNRLPFGGGEPQLVLSEGESPLAGIECLTAPTPTRRPPRGYGAIWRLISHLSLGHLSLVGGEEGAAALREMLGLYNLQDATDARNNINAILAVDSRRVVGRITDEYGGGIARGTEITIQFSPDQFSENGMFLFAMVLERFLGLSCSINSFSQLVVRLKGREGPWRSWPPRSGEKVLL